MCVSSPLATWTLLMTLLAFHLVTNYRAARAVKLRSLNRQRTNMVISHLWEHDHVMTPTEVARQERLFEWDGVLRWTDRRILGTCELGLSMRELLFSRELAGGAATEKTPSVTLSACSDPLICDMKRVLSVFEHEDYILSVNSGSLAAAVVLKEGATAVTGIKAWTHALLAMRSIAGTKDRSTMTKQPLMSASGLDLAGLLQEINLRFDNYLPRLSAAGWNLDVSAIETRSGSRLAGASPACASTSV